MKAEFEISNLFYNVTWKPDPYDAVECENKQLSINNVLATNFPLPPID